MGAAEVKTIVFLLGTEHRHILYINNVSVALEFLNQVDRSNMLLQRNNKS
jgi:hypothetical protein